MTRRKIVELLIGIALLVLVVFAGWYLTSPRFQQYVRHRIVAELETLTGGDVEIRDLRWNLSQLTFDIYDITIHGREAAGQRPFVHIDELHVRAKIISLLQKKIGLERLIAERPMVHIIVNPDGTTNRPEPATRQQRDRSAVEELLQLAMNRMELRQGELLWNEGRMPIDLAANDLAFTMRYNGQKQRYDGQLNIGKLDGKFRDYRPVSSTVELQFGLTPAVAEVKSLHWSSQQTRLEATGRVVDFKNPRWEVTYNLSVDLRQAGSVARVRQLQGGVLDVTGQGAFSKNDFSSQGKIAVRNVRWQQPGMNLDKADVSSNFNLNRNQFLLTSLNGRAWGGIFKGELELRNWLPPSEAAARGEQKLQSGKINLRLEGIDIAQVAAAVATKSAPLDRVNAVGLATGEARATWSGKPQLGTAQIAASVAPPSQVASNELPITAQIDATYKGAQESLQVKKLDLSTRGTRLSATGVMAPSSRLAVHLTTTDLNELRPALAVFDISDLPVELNGRASFNGNVSGRLRSPVLAGHLEVRDFLSQLQAKSGLQAASSKPASTTKQIHWDLLSADIDVGSSSATLRNGRLLRGATNISFDVTATLQNYKFSERNPFTAALNIKDASIADLQQIAGYNYPIDGTANVSANLRGTRVDPRGAGVVQITNGIAYQQPLRSVTADFNLAANELRVHNLNLAAEAGKLSGAGSYNLKSESFHFDVTGSNWSLAELRPLQTAKFQVKGLAGFRAQGSGTAKAPVINASLHLRQLEIDEEKAGDLDLEANTRGTEMLIKARSHFEDSELLANGTVQLRGDLPVNLEVRFTRLDFDPLLKGFLKGEITEHSSTAGIAHIHGPLRRPRELNALVELQQFRMDVEKIVLENRGPIRFSLANQNLKVETLHVVGDATDITANGSLSLAPGGTADLRADGRMNLRLLQTFNPDVVASGLMTLSMRVGGELKSPSLSGTVQVSDAAISLVDLPNGLSDINGNLTFDQDRLEVRQLTARSGGGLLNVSGFITYSQGLFADLRARGRDIRVRYPQGVSAVADLNLRFQGNIKRSNLSGDVVVTKFGVNPRFDFALYLARSAQPPAVSNPDSPLNNMQLDIHVTSTPELQVQTSLGAKLSGNVDLRVRGTAARPVVLGRINVLEGDVFFSGTRYHLERGDISFSNPVRIEPVLNLEASARVRDVDITLGFHGSVDRLNVTYHSDPPMATADIIALLAMGRTPEDTVLSTQPQPNLTETASNAILSQAAEAFVSSRAQRLFGVSRIKIDPQIGGPENNPNARVTVEQQVSDKVTLTYITNLAQSAQQVIQVEVQVNKRVSIVAVRDEFGVFGLEVKLRQRKW